MSAEPESFDDAVERLIASREAQGLGRHVTDPATLDRLAGLVADSRPRNTRRRRPTAPRRTAQPVQNAE